MRNGTIKSVALVTREREIWVIITMVEENKYGDRQMDMVGS